MSFGHHVLRSSLVPGVDVASQGGGPGSGLGEEDDAANSPGDVAMLRSFLTAAEGVRSARKAAAKAAAGKGGAGGKRPSR